MSRDPIDRGDLLAGVLVLAFICGVVLLFSWAGTRDGDEWERIDDRCFLRVDHREGVWPFDGDLPPDRETYCLAASGGADQDHA